MKEMRCSLACFWKTLRKAPALACTSSPCGCGHSALWPVAPLGTYGSYMVEASESMVRRRQPAAEGCPALSSRALMHPLCMAARRCSYRVTGHGGEQRRGAGELQWGVGVQEMTFQAWMWGLLDHLVGRMGIRLFEGRCRGEGRWTIWLAGINTAVLLKAYRSDVQCCISTATTVPPSESLLLLLELG